MRENLSNKINLKKKIEVMIYLYNDHYLYFIVCTYVHKMIKKSDLKGNLLGKKNTACLEYVIKML